MGDGIGAGVGVCAAIKRVEAGKSVCGDIAAAVVPFVASNVWPDLLAEDANVVRQCLKDAKNIPAVTRGFVQFFASWPDIFSLVNSCGGDTKPCNLPPIINAVEHGALVLVAPYTNSGDPYPDQINTLLNGYIKLVDMRGPYNYASLAGRIDFVTRKGHVVPKVVRAGHTIEIHKGNTGLLTLFRVEKGAPFGKETPPPFISDYLSYKGKGFDRRKFKRDVKEREDLIRERIYAQAAVLGHVVLAGGELSTTERDFNCFADVFHNGSETDAHDLKENACHSPADHLRAEGWRPIDLRTEPARPGDLLVYFTYITRKFILPGSENYSRHTLEQFGYLHMQHAAVVILTDDNGDPLLARHKFDQLGPFTLGSPFAVPAEYGDVFAVLRK